MLRRKVERVLERSGPAAGEPRPQGGRRDPRDVPARRALPDLGGRSARNRDGRPAPGRAPARQALRPAGRVRALVLLSRLPAARPLQHGEPPAGRGDPQGGARRRQRRLRDARVRVGAHPAALRHPHRARERGRVRRRRDRGPPRRGDARLDRRLPRRAHGGARRGTRRAAVREVRRGVPRSRTARTSRRARPCST